MTTLPIVRKFNDSHGVEITFYEWPVSQPKAIVQISHGLGEHARRWDDMAMELNRAGFTVYADDHRGHGHLIAKGGDPKGMYAELLGRCCPPVLAALVRLEERRQLPASSLLVGAVLQVPIGVRVCRVLDELVRLGLATCAREGTLPRWNLTERGREASRRGT